MLTTHEWAAMVETITRRTVERLLRAHEQTTEDFDADFPLAEAYDAVRVVEWLGY